MIHEVMQGCINQVRKIVYALQPAAIDGMGRRWHAHNRASGPMSKAGESVRLFDVVQSLNYKQAVVFGGTAQDYEQELEINIVYGMDENYHHLAASDFAAIANAVQYANIGDVPGLHYYRCGDPSMEVMEDALLLKIPVLCHITATMTEDLGSYFFGEGGWGG
jgi:hypothetical protein